MQTLMQSADVAVEAAIIVMQAASMKQSAQRNVAELWTDGSLGGNDGLPERKTRIYIPATMACKQSTKSKKSTLASAGSQSGVDASVIDGGQPPRKKRKGKSERNRLKKEAEAALQQTDAAATL